MSRHSKWAKIKHQKTAEDVRRGAIFTKMARGITVAAKEGGGDPATNFKLRLAIDQARALNMPKENIERAIKRGTGELTDGAKIEAVLYEGFLPGGIALIIESLTDNKTRTASTVKHLLSKHSGNLNAPNSALWMFEKKGIIRCKGANQEKEKFQLQLIESGAEDLIEEEGGWTIYTKPEELQNVKENLEKKGITIEFASTEWTAKNKIEIKDQKMKENLENLCEELDNEDDIDNYFTNAAGF